MARSPASSQRSCRLASPAALASSCRLRGCRQLLVRPSTRATCACVVGKPSPAGRGGQGRALQRGESNLYMLQATECCRRCPRTFTFQQKTHRRWLQEAGEVGLRGCGGRVLAPRRADAEVLQVRTAGEGLQACNNPEMSRSYSAQPVRDCRHATLVRCPGPTVPHLVRECRHATMVRCPGLQSRHSR